MKQLIAAIMPLFMMFLVQTASAQTAHLEPTVDEVTFNKVQAEDGANAIQLNLPQATADRYHITIRDEHGAMMHDEILRTPRYRRTFLIDLDEALIVVRNLRTGKRSVYKVYNTERTSRAIEIAKIN